MAHKQGYLRSLSKPPEIADFSQEKPVVMVARASSPIGQTATGSREDQRATAVLRALPGLYANRITYTLIFETYYVDEHRGHSAAREPHSFLD